MAKRVTNMEISEPERVGGFIGRQKGDKAVFFFSKSVKEEED